MKTIQQIKDEKESKISEVIAASSMFFAFSDEQFEKNKTPKAEGEKYLSLGAGAFIPQSKVKVYLDGVEAVDKWYKAEVKNNKQRKADILYELCNHEAFYTGTIDDTLDALGEGYTRAEVLEVYRAERNKQTA